MGAGPEGSTDEGGVLLHKPSEIDLVSALVRYATGETGAYGQRERVIGQRLNGGYISKTVDSIELTITDPSGAQLTTSFVQKACLETEVRSDDQIPGSGIHQLAGWNAFTSLNHLTNATLPKRLTTTKATSSDAPPAVSKTKSNPSSPVRRATISMGDSALRTNCEFRTIEWGNTVE